MHKKLTITVDEKVYAGLHKTIGPRKISKFVEELVRPYTTSKFGTGLRQNGKRQKTRRRSLGMGRDNF